MALSVVRLVGGPRLRAPESERTGRTDRRVVRTRRDGCYRGAAIRASSPLAPWFTWSAPQENQEREQGRSAHAHADRDGHRETVSDADA